jgi:protein FrlC
MQCLRFAQSSAVYFNHSLQHAIRDLSELGYDGIEIWGGRPHMYRHDLDEQIEEIRGLLAQRRLQVCNFIPAQFRYPSQLCSDNERVRRESVAYISDGVDNALKLGSPSVSICPGMVLFDRDRRRGYRCLLESLREIEAYSRGKEILLLIEPAHRFESNLVLTIDDCLRLLEELKSDRFGILLDTGHCHVNGEDFRAIIPRCQGLPLHIHLDDNHGDADAHLIPGRGSVDFAGLAEALKASGYSGFLSAELGGAYNMDPGAACRESLDVMRSLFGD